MRSLRLSLLTHVLGATALCATVAPTSAMAKESPRARTESFLAALKAVKPKPETGALTDADRAINKKAFENLDGYFDFVSLTEDAIRPHLAKFTPEQLTTYKTVFTELIRRVAYPDSGAFLGTAKTKLGKEKTSGAKAEVPMDVDVPKDDLKMAVVFYWADASTWRLVDVAFDGASLTKDYQNQFGRIIDKDGVAGLLKKLQDRLEKERKASVL